MYKNLYMNVLPEALFQDNRLAYIWDNTYTHIYTYMYVYTFFSNVTQRLCISWAFFPGKCRASSQLPESALKPSSFPPQDGLLASPIMAYGPNKFPKMSNGCTLVLVRLASFYDRNEVSKSPLGNAWAPRGEFKYKYSSKLPFLILFLKSIIMTGIQSPHCMDVGHKGEVCVCPALWRSRVTRGQEIRQAYWWTCRIRAALGWPQGGQAVLGMRKQRSLGFILDYLLSFMSLN